MIIREIINLEEMFQATKKVFNIKDEEEKLYRIFFMDGADYGWYNGCVKLENNLEKILDKFSKKYGLENYSVEGKVYHLVKILEKLDSRD